MKQGSWGKRRRRRRRGDDDDDDVSLHTLMMMMVGEATPFSGYKVPCDIPLHVVDKLHSNRMNIIINGLFLRVLLLYIQCPLYTSYGKGEAKNLK